MGQKEALASSISVAFCFIFVTNMSLFVSFLLGEQAILVYIFLKSNFKDKGTYAPSGVLVDDVLNKNGR